MPVTIDATAPVPTPGTSGRDTKPRRRPAGSPGAPQAGHPDRIAGADALRAVAAIGVIVVHTSAWALQSQGADRAVWYSVTLLARFCVPAFVLLTGLVLAWRYGEHRLDGAFLLRRARRSILPFLVWAPVFCLAGVFWDGEIARSAGAVRDWWSLGGGHLYYLILVPQLYLLLLLWPSHRRAAVALAGALLGVQVGIDTYRLYASIGGTGLRQALLDHGYLAFPLWIGYFALGVAAGHVLKARRGHGFSAWPFVVAVPVAAGLLLWVDRAGMVSPAFAGGTGAFLRPLMIPYALAVCGAVVFGAPALLRRVPRVDRAVSLISRHSLGIYIVHPLLLAAIAPLTRGGLDAHLPVSIAAEVGLVTAVAVAALLITMVIGQIPLAATIGEHRRRREPERELRGRAAQPQPPRREVARSL